MTPPVGAWLTRTMLATVALFTLILSASGPTGAGADENSATALYACGFEADDDRNYDLWPDGWTRRRGPDYPLYVEAAIAPDYAGASRWRLAPRRGRGALFIAMNGAAAALTSPLQPISPLFSYSLTIQAAVEEVRDARVAVSLVFYDERQQPVETHSTRLERGGDAWTPLAIGPVAPSHPGVRFVAAELQVEPGEKVDLRGAALFDDLQITRLPRMTVRLSSPTAIVSLGEPLTVTCDVSGAPRRRSLVRFQLLDRQGRVIASSDEPAQIAAGPESKGAISLKGDGPAREVFAGQARWTPPIREAGLYRVRASLGDGETSQLERSLTLAVIRDEPAPAGGEFGWSLRPGEPLPLPVIEEMARRSGIGWLKMPVWIGVDEAAQAERLSRFAEQLARQGVRFVGVLDTPPDDLRPARADAARPAIATVLSESEQWREALVPALTNLSLNIRHWQLGEDDDTSFVGFGGLPETLGEIRQHMRRFGRAAHLGIAWSWLAERPAAGAAAPAWDFLAYTEEGQDPPLASSELAAYLQAEAGRPERVWVALRPLTVERYEEGARARDLMQRMMAAKMHGAEAAFFTNPFAGRGGLFSPDGEPTDLYLPWRTTAVMLAGAEHLGSLPMRSGCRNEIFARGDRAVMVVWSEQPVREAVCLGDDIEQVDLWGRPSRPALVDGQHVIDVGPLPTFLAGLDARLARWQMSVAFGSDRLDSVFARRQPLALKYVNTLGQGVSGQVTVHAPAEWEVSARKAPIRLGAGERREQPLTVALRSDASTGEHEVRVEFDLVADRPYRFSVSRPVQVGLGDVEIEMTSRLNERGDLVVEQQLINRRDEPVSFNCQLFAPQRRRIRRPVFGLHRGQVKLTYVVPNGQELLGQTLLLRAEEINGPRVLNCRHVVE